MPLTAKKLFPPAQLTDAEVAYYEVLAPIVTTILERIVACNTTADDHTVTMWLVPAFDEAGDPGVPGPDNLILFEYAFLGNTTKECSELRQQVLKRGDKLYAKADANEVITIHGSGLELKVAGQT